MNGNIQITFLLGPGFLLPWAVLVAGSTPDGREYGQLCVSRQPSKAERPGLYHSRGREFPPASKTRRNWVNATEMECAEGDLDGEREKAFDLCKGVLK